MRAGLVSWSCAHVTWRWPGAWSGARYTWPGAGSACGQVQPGRSGALVGRIVVHGLDRGRYVPGACIRGGFPVAETSPILEYPNIEPMAGRPT